MPAKSGGIAIVGLTVAALALSSCGLAGARDESVADTDSVAGTDETDRIARVVADAISYPRRDSAEALVRAAIETRAGSDGRLSVIAAQDLEARELVDPLARLVFRIKPAGYEEVRTSEDPRPLIACYEAFFNYYGVIDSPERVDCPEGAQAITPEPVQPTPRVIIPDGSDDAVRAALEELPTAVTAAEVVAAIRAELPAIEPDPVTGVTNVAATPEAVVVGFEIGVSMRADRACLFAARTDAVTVWHAGDEVQPGELSCDPKTALSIVTAAPDPRPY